ncbi:UNVERIFIED_CONTAM: hypothetical protein FKN15_046660 [Acipenser sinensis]
MSNYILGSAHCYHPCADSGVAKTNTRCPPKRVPSADRFFSLCWPACSQPRATVSEDSAALGSLQASSQAPGQSTEVAGARRAEDTLADLSPPPRAALGQLYAAPWELLFTVGSGIAWTQTGDLEATGCILHSTRSTGCATQEPLGSTVFHLNAFLLIYYQKCHASFYGDGYMELKTVESWSRSSLYVRFRTSRPSGMLFLAAGHTDYCLVELHSTRLQVKLDLGSGERILRSEKGTPLNDLAWHTAELQHDNNSVTLTVDKHFQASVRMPGQLHVLSIQEGLYVGGTGGLDKPYLVTEPSGFRGCIDELLFNQHNLLSSLRSYYGFKHVYEVSLGCSPQFFASEDDPVSFFSSKAYISFPLWNVREGGVFECMVHTSAEQGLLLYNSARQGDFVAMEIREGLIIAVVGKGGSKNELSSLSQVNDRKWHYIKLQFTSRNLQLTVDEETVKKILSSPSKALSLRGPLFIGGIDDSTRAEVRNQGLVSVSGKRARGGSFKGCLKDIKANSEKMGLKNAVVTKDISVGCEPEKEPEPTMQATPTTVPLPQIPSTFAAVPTSAKPQEKKHGSFLALNNLVVPEGGRASLGSKHIKVSLEFKKLGIRQSQIVFKIQEQPVHGQLRLDIDQDQEENTFSMLDLWHGRVMYVHGGSEDPLDFFMFSVFASSKKEVPPYLKGNKQYRFNISVTPTNDAPELTLLEGNLFVLLENSKKPLTTDVLKATDVDSNSTELVFSVLGNLNADAGYLENTKNPGKVLNTFSHTDLEEGRIQYVHSGVRNSRIVLRVSDGDKVSNTVVLRIMAIPLDYNIANNTGVEVTQGEVALIGTNHLAVQTNAVKQELDLRYDIIEPPKYGEVQRWHSSGEWKPTNTFSQRTLERERVRYVSTYQELQSSNATDNFKCKVSIGSLASEELFFPVKVKWVQYKLLKNSALEIDKVRRVALNSEHLHAIVEGVTVAENNLYYRLLTLPKKGKLLLNNKVLKKNSTFSQRNVTEQKVEYELVERPREDSKDMFTFQVLSKHAHSGAYDFKLAIKADVNSIILTNTGLSLIEGERNLFVLLENSKKPLTTDVLKATDVDSNSTVLVFSVLGNADAGYLENTKNPGKVLNTFSHTDLEEGRIQYVHSGVRNSRIVLRVSDGDKVSNTVVLRIMAIPLDYNIANNTGVEVTQGEVALIGTNHLAVQTNAVKQELDLRYDIIEPPKYGEVQRWHSSGEWKPTNTFSQRTLERERVRYVSTYQELQSSNATDNFKCKVSIGSLASEELFFPVTVKWVQYKLLKNSALEIDKVRRVALNSEHLHAIVEGVTVAENNLYYRLLTLPKKGRLLLNNKVLKKNSTFSQRNVTEQKVEYELVERPREDSKDMFTFQVLSKHAHSGAYDFKLAIKADVNSIILTNTGLSLIEGESKLISKEELFSETLITKEMFYKITSSPRHGKLKRINLSDSASSSDNMTMFTNADILGERILYVHDDSETTHDEFTFIASLNKSGAGAAAVESSFNISIELKNDEKPVRVVDKIFHVARNGQKLLTVEDLCYHDGDSDFDDGQLLYTRRGIPNGDLVLVNDTSHKLYQFHQEDLELRRVLFLHHGTDYGRFVLFVTDGKHYTSSLLEVSAHKPYIQIANSTGLLVQKGHAASFNVANFSVATNMDVRDDKEVTYKLFLPPKHGRLHINDLLVDSFTQHDLRRGHLVYQHDNSNNLVDRFNFTVKVKDVRLDAGVFVRVYLESHQRPPKVVHNRTLLVEEGKPVKISKRKLEVVHEDSLPVEIVYTVKIAPTYGYIRSSAEGEGRYLGSEQAPIQSFTQQDINDGNIQYVHVAADQHKDSIELQVSNGVTEVGGLQVCIDVIPRLIPLKVSSITLKEGAAKALTEDIIQVTSQHFAGLDFEYSVWEPPQHGQIEHSRSPGVKLLVFTRKQVQQEFIYYVHDDSETTSDNFTIIANDTELRKQSQPCTVYVNVMPVNDEPPVITANTILKVWVSSVTEITKADLNSEDKDSPPEELDYVITPPSNGHLALKSSANKSILNFTQAHVNNGEVVFVHSGSLTSISSEDLQAVTNDEDGAGNRTITFTLVSSPTLGRLVRVEPDNSTVEISTFTQAMVDEGAIAYEQTNLESIGWSAEDSFRFTVSSPPASLDPHVFNIIISYENTGPERRSLLLANTGAGHSATHCCTPYQCKHCCTPYQCKHCCTPYQCKHCCTPYQCKHCCTPYQCKHCCTPYQCKHCCTPYQCKHCCTPYQCKHCCTPYQCKHCCTPYQCKHCCTPYQCKHCCTPYQCKHCCTPYQCKHCCTPYQCKHCCTPYQCKHCCTPYQCKHCCTPYQCKHCCTPYQCKHCCTPYQCKHCCTPYQCKHCCTPYQCKHCCTPYQCKHCCTPYQCKHCAAPLVFIYIAASTAAHWK